MKITALSTFDIHPVNDGGRRRYNSVLKPLSKHHDVTLLAYHLADSAQPRRYWLADRFEVVSVPTRPEDLHHCWDQYSRTQRIAHDILCIREYSLSENFKKEAATVIGRADVVIVSHPYLIIIAKTYAKSDAILIYESYNVEFDAKVTHFASIAPDQRRSYIQDVTYAEGLACRSCHYVTAVSETDAHRLANLYGINQKRITVLPNGVDISAYPQISRDDQRAFRSRLGVGPEKDLAVFVGSAYGPNVDAYKRARRILATAGFSGAVVLVGSIADADRSTWDDVDFSEIWLGFVEDDLRVAAVTCADFALQFMFEGAGTNLKLFDYMAARTLIVANSFGVRGVIEDEWCVTVENADEMRKVLEAKPWFTASGQTLVQRARDIAEKQFDWQSIAKKFDALIRGRMSAT